ncbi:hypothetical protein KA089_01660 [Candidatus Woesebacteria bacterium]|nr:hypothetical protein [Candidatus Woesebacteria bacterium]
MQNYDELRHLENREKLQLNLGLNVILVNEPEPTYQDASFGFPAMPGQEKERNPLTPEQIQKELEKTLEKITESGGELVDIIIIPVSVKDGPYVYSMTDRTFIIVSKGEQPIKTESDIDLPKKLNIIPIPELSDEITLPPIYGPDTKARITKNAEDMQTAIQTIIEKIQRSGGITKKVMVTGFRDNDYHDYPNIPIISAIVEKID